MSESRRVQRVEKELRDIIASYVLRNCANDFLSINHVKASKDLRQAKVYVSRIGEDKVSEEKLEELQELGPNIQKEISKNLRMKYCPKLIFYNDESVAMNQKIDKILTQIKS